MTYNSTENLTIYDDSGERGAEVTSDNDLQTTARMRDGNGNPILEATPLFIQDKPRPGDHRSTYFENGSSKDMLVDGSVTPVEFIVTPNPGKKFIVKTISVIMESRSMNFNKFGGITGGLTNGVLVKVKEGGNSEFQIGTVIKKNKDFYEGAVHVLIQSSDTDILEVRYEIKTTSGTILELADSRSDYIKFVIQDELDVVIMNQFYVLAIGYEVDE